MAKKTSDCQKFPSTEGSAVVPKRAIGAKNVPKLPKNVPEMPECHEGSANMCQQRQKYTKRCHERAQRAKDVPKGAEYGQTAQKCQHIICKIISNL
jgi:hypothetical protein